MKNIVIALTAAIMVVIGSLSFAAEYSTVREQPVYQNGYSQQQRQVYSTRNGHGHSGHMFKLSDRAKRDSKSWWDSFCDFWGGHGDDDQKRNR